MDRTYAERCQELLQAISGLGFGKWEVAPVGQSFMDPEAQLNGVELSSGDVVLLQWYNSHRKITPKHITFSLIRQRNGQSIVIGVHVGTLRYTDLRTMQSYYDGASWGPTHFRAQMAVEQYRGTLVISPDAVEKRLACAVEKLVEIGITNTKHVLLPPVGCDEMHHVSMVPWIRADYGAMPIAIRVKGVNAWSLALMFYAIEPRGFVNLAFGYLNMTDGAPDASEMDIGKLLANPLSKQG